MNFKVLGIIAIICAPFLYVDFATSTPNVSTWKTGFFGFIYMVGWLCSVFALQRMQILGKTKFAKIAFIIQFVLLALAQIWNIWVMFGSDYNNLLFRILDMCWPLSNIWMLVIGITAVKAKKLLGWKRYVPLIVGLWFPLMIIPAMVTGFFFLAGPYSAIAFVLLGFIVYKSREEEQTPVGNVVVA